MILLNLFTAVVLENFEIQEEQAEWTLTPAALEVRSMLSQDIMFIIKNSFHEANAGLCCTSPVADVF